MPIREKSNENKTKNVLRGKEGKKRKKEQICKVKQRQIKKINFMLICKIQEKRKKKEEEENFTELQNPNVEAEVNDNNEKCD